MYIANSLLHMFKANNAMNAIEMSKCHWVTELPHLVTELPHWITELPHWVTELLHW